MQTETRVWDPLVRLFHWSLVAGFSVGYFTQEQHYELHLQAGYTVMGLVIFRVFWGIVGPRFARFTNFVYRPSTVWAYLRALVTGSARRYLGHNPLGGVNVILLLLTLAVISVSGIALDAAENRAGPLGDTTLFYYRDPIIAAHVLSTYLCLGLIAAHLAGVVHASLKHRENLVRSMFTGRKREK